MRSSSDDRAQLLEPGDLGLRERLVHEVGERRAAPERERLAERRLGGLPGSPACSASLASSARRDEHVHVDGLPVELEHVARADAWR